VTKYCVPGEEQKSVAEVIVAVGSASLTVLLVSQLADKVWHLEFVRAPMEKKQHPVMTLESPGPSPTAVGEVDLIDPKAAARKAQQKAITRGLRKFFDAVAAEPVPEDFLDLLHKLDADKTDANT
jgi:Anti-sigma factor NepR